MNYFYEEVESVRRLACASRWVALWFVCEAVQFSHLVVELYQYVVVSFVRLAGRVTSQRTCPPAFGGLLAYVVFGRQVVGAVASSSELAGATGSELLLPFSAAVLVHLLFLEQGGCGDLR